MRELRSFVEEARIIFIALNHNDGGIVQTRTLAEIIGDAANHPRGILPSQTKDVSEERCRGRLSMRAGDDEVSPPAQEEISQCLRERLIRNAAVEHRLELNIPATH